MAEHTGSAPNAQGSSHLVTVPSGQSIVDATCANAWRADDGTRTGVVWVTADGGPDDAISQLRRTANGTMPATVDVITVGDAVRSATAADTGLQSTTVPFGPSDLTVHALPDGTDLAVIGEAIIDRVRAVERAGREVVVCFDALAPVLAAHDLRTVFQFLHVLTANIRSCDGTIHVAVDPADLDRHALATLAPIFDDSNRAHY